MESKVDEMEILFQDNCELFINQFMSNVQNETIKQLDILKKNISSLKTSDSEWKFPSDHVVEAYSESMYELLYNRVCHSAAIALISWFKEKSLIFQDNIPFSLRENNIEEAKTQIMQPFSVGRFLIKASKQSSLHEFVIINLKSKIYLIQADMYRQLKVQDEGGFLELTEKDIEGLFSNNQATFKKLFDLPDTKKANLSIEAFDCFKIQQVGMQFEEKINHSDTKNEVLHDDLSSLKSPIATVENFKSAMSDMRSPLERVKKEHQILYDKDKEGIFGGLYKTETHENWKLEEFVHHASENNNRSRLAFRNLSWMDADGKLTENAPQELKDIVQTGNNKNKGLAK